MAKAMGRPLNAASGTSATAVDPSLESGKASQDQHHRAGLPKAQDGSGIGRVAQLLFQDIADVVDPREVPKPPANDSAALIAVAAQYTMLRLRG
nr:hypothetical protein GCM10010200_035320 [Actinomadura rugatobispora]